MYSKMKPLGTDQHGFRYYYNPTDRYVYQQYPAVDYWKNGANMKDKPNGWICNLTAWENKLHELID